MTNTEGYEILLRGFIGLFIIAIIGEAMHLFVPINWVVAIVSIVCFIV
jgi:hypothetical protein